MVGQGHRDPATVEIVGSGQRRSRRSIERDHRAGVGRGRDDGRSSKQ